MPASLLRGICGIRAGILPAFCRKRGGVWTNARLVRVAFLTSIRPHTCHRSAGWRRHNELVRRWACFGRWASAHRAGAVQSMGRQPIDGRGPTDGRRPVDRHAPTDGRRPADRRRPVDRWVFESQVVEGGSGYEAKENDGDRDCERPAVRRLRSSVPAGRERPRRGRADRGACPVRGRTAGGMRGEARHSRRRKRGCCCNRHEAVGGGPAA